MTADRLVELLITADVPISARALIEASVHMPKRGTRWVASYRDATGRQIWRTTGLTDREAATALARRWEQQAKSTCAVQGSPSKKLALRVRPGSSEQILGLLTQQQVAKRLGLSTRYVRQLERRALQKLRRDPSLKAFWREWLSRQVTESSCFPTWVPDTNDVKAVLGLVFCES
jgi:hypothetical protein